MECAGDATIGIQEGWSRWCSASWPEAPDTKAALKAVWASRGKSEHVTANIHTYSIDIEEAVVTEGFAHVYWGTNWENSAGITPARKASSSRGWSKSTL